MKTGIYFLIQSLSFTILLMIIYFNKKRLENIDNRIYSNLIIVSFVEIVLELLLDIIMPNYDKMLILSTIAAKTYCAVIAIWLTLLSMYITIVSLILKNKKQLQEITKKIYIVVGIICVILIYIAPIKFHNQNGEYYTYGNSVNIDYIMSFTYAFIGVICLIWNNKNIKNKKFIPILLFIILGGICGYIQMMYPSLLLSTAVHTFITFLMYFTIENPDLQMVEELNKNRKLTEQNIEEKTNFLFKISQDLKKPLQDITNISNSIYENTNGEIKEQAKQINANSKQLYTYVNNALDISTMDIKNLKIVKGTYNTKNFFEEIKLRIKEEIKQQNKDIELRYNISKNMPEYLQGDNTKLKQAITSIAFDAIKHTEKGFIELNVDSIVRYGICRLLIEISDSGRGMELEKINEILSVSKEITQEEIEKIDKLNISLTLAHKIIKTLNGSLIIKSEMNNGTNFLIAINQKIENKQNNQQKTLEQYSKKIINQKQIMMITSNIQKIKEIKKELEDINIVSSPFPKESLEQIEKQKFECVIVDEDLNEETGINIIKEIKKINTKIPVIILISKKNEFLNKHYLEEGVDEYIIKDNHEEYIKKIKKYL